MDIKGIIESEFGFKVKNIVVLGQGLDSIAYLVNEEYIFKMSKHEEARLNSLLTNGATTTLLFSSQPA